MAVPSTPSYRRNRPLQIIAAVPDEHRAVLVPQLRAKPVRTASGIAVVAIMSKPHRCPHIATTGNICVYCPGGPDSGESAAGPDTRCTGARFVCHG